MILRMPVFTMIPDPYMHVHSEILFTCILLCIRASEKVDIRIGIGCAYQQNSSGICVGFSDMFDTRFWGK